MVISLSNLLEKSNFKEKRKDSLNTAVFSMSTLTERSKRIEMRNIPSTPFRILDAPGIIDDYYLNLLDWSQNKILISLKDTVYFYNTETKEVNEIFCTENGYISSIKSKDQMLAIGDSKGILRIFDFNRNEVIKKKQLHKTRICSLSFNEKYLSSGSKDGIIINTDFRQTNNTFFKGHSLEVCGLKWSPNNEYLASGSNDNSIKIWKMGYPIAKTLKGHQSAIKALDWCPWKSNILCSGGGARDQSIRFWDVLQPQEIKQINVDSQVCSLTYLSKYKELLTGHGFQQNDLKLWKCSGMRLIKSFGTHESRILHTAVSPDECTVVSLGADESLKFWKIAENPVECSKRDSIGLR